MHIVSKLTVCKTISMAKDLSKISKKKLALYTHTRNRSLVVLVVKQPRPEESFAHENSNYRKLWDTERLPGSWDKETSLAAFPVRQIFCGERTKEKNGTGPVAFLTFR